MNIVCHSKPWRALLTGALLVIFSGLAAAEPPSRAARLAYLNGTVSFSPAGDGDWLRAVANRPLTNGDRLWVDARSRAEVQMGGAALQLGASTSLTLLDFSDRMAQLQLSQGSLRVRVRSIRPGDRVEINTPNLALTLRQTGDYRIDVNASDDTTSVVVRSGRAEAFGQGVSYAIGPRQSHRFHGTELDRHQAYAARPDDDLDRWSRERDRRVDNSVSARYVSVEVVGYDDLDANGSWRRDRTYGDVWTPNRVAAGWTPYRDGHWSWIHPWGWTWVDDAPWGYAVSHYGRWAHLGNAWSWVPGPRRERAVYAPALVVFIGGKNFQASVSIGSNVADSVGWLPLAPREVYQPSYAVSRGYFDRINRSNAVIAPATLTTVYNTTIVNTTVINNNTVINDPRGAPPPRYANQQIAGAVVAVPMQAFVQSRPVAPASVALAPQVAAAAPIIVRAPVTPVQQSVHGGAPSAGAKPPERQPAIVARTAPPPAPVPFAAQQRQLAERPGRPLDDSQRGELKGAPAPAPAPAPKINVVTAPADPRPIPQLPLPSPAAAPVAAQPAAPVAAPGGRPAISPALPPGTPVVPPVAPVGAPPVSPPAATPVTPPAATPVAPRVAPSVSAPVLAPPAAPRAADPSRPAPPAFEAPRRASAALAEPVRPTAPIAQPARPAAPIAEPARPATPIAEPARPAGAITEPQRPTRAPVAPPVVSPPTELPAPPVRAAPPRATDPAADGPGADQSRRPAIRREDRPADGPPAERARPDRPQAVPSAAPEQVKPPVPAAGPTKAPPVPVPGPAKAPPAPPTPPGPTPAAAPVNAAAAAAAAAAASAARRPPIRPLPDAAADDPKKDNKK